MPYRDQSALPIAHAHGSARAQGSPTTAARVNLRLGRVAETETLAVKGLPPELSPPMSLQVGIVSHQLLFSSLLGEHLVTSCGATVEVSCTSWAELLQHHAANPPLDLLLIDGDGMDGVGEWLPELQKRRIANKVMLFTDRPAAYLVHRVFQLGLNGLFHKQDSREVLHSALSTVLAGGLFVTPHVNVGDRQQFSHVLSDREVAVMAKLSIGLSPAQAAKELAISAGTVLTHRRNFMRKLGLRSQVAVVLFAVRSGLVTLGQINQPQAGVTKRR